MSKEFHQIVWDKALEDDCRQLVRLAVREDLDRKIDVTTMALIDPDSQGQAVLVAREGGLVCGLRACEVVLDEMEIHAQWTPHLEDGEAAIAGTALGTLSGPARSADVGATVAQLRRPTLGYRHMDAAIRSTGGRDALSHLRHA